MNQILYNTSRTPDKKKVILFVLIALICIIICLSTVFALTNKGNENIIKNVYISEIDVSEKSKDEAKKLVSEKMNSYKNKDLSLTVGGKEYLVSSNDIGFYCSNIDEVVEEAYNYGRDGSFLQNNFTILLSNFKNKELELKYSVNENNYDDLIEKIVATNESLVFDDTYEVVENKLIIRKGQDGLKIATDELKDYIVTAMLNDVNTIEVPIENSKSKKLDLNKVYSEVCVAPQNASFTTGENFEFIEEKNGVDFDVALAKDAYDKHEGSGEVIIDLRIVEPSIKVADLDSKLFKDVLSTFSTTYDTSEKNRVQNLTVASDRCNGTVVYPGEEFSFHKTVGTRTIANGYALGSSFASGGRVVETVGGGICQISSTLYNIVLKADLEIVERKNHGLYVTYAEPSLDATIAEGSIDFRFKNNRKSPIKVVSEVKNGVVTMSILGIKTLEDKNIELESVVIETLAYSVIEQKDSTMLKGTTKVVQEPLEGYISEAYKIVKDANGNEISRTLISKDKYAATNKIIKVGTKVNTPPPVVTPPVEVVVPETPVTPEVPVTPEIPEEPERDLPPGWDSPESPYGN